MRSPLAERSLKKLTFPQSILVLLIAGIAFFIFMKGFRRGEPWQLTFAKTTPGFVDISISHKRLGINRVILKTDVVAPSKFQDTTVQMAKRTELPAGTLVFSDFTNLPGRFRFQIGNHTVDIMERALLIDGTEITWKHALERPIDLNDLRPQ